MKFEVKSCKLKTRFRTEFDAKKKGKEIGLRAYPCRFCKGWHLTSSQENQ